MRGLKAVPELHVVADAQALRRGVTQHREADYLFQDDLRRVAELADGRALLDAAGF